MQREDHHGPLSAYARYLRKTESKSLAQRKNLWLLLVSKEGLAIAEDAGVRLNIDPAMLASWIEEWLHDEHRPGMPA